jgi:ATP-dependent nuclease, subunit B
MLRFITGGTGTGKSTYIINELVSDLKAGKHVILLVPEQKAVIAERSVELLAADVPTINLEILNFTRLCNRVFREYGGLAYNYIGKGAKNLILWKVLNQRKSELTEFGDIIPTDKNFIRLMAGTIKEFGNYNISPDLLYNVSDGLTQTNKRLADKLHDMALVYNTYETVIKTEYNALTDELRQLSSMLSEHNFFSGYNVYIDSFNGFTQVEYDIIERIIHQADNVNIAIACDLNDVRPIYDNVRRTYDELLNIARDVEVTHVTLNEKVRFRNDELTYLADKMWSNVYYETAYLTSPENIRVVECDNIFTEAEMAAKDIIKKIRNGARYHDIVVITRDVTQYYGIIDAVFERYGIPFFMSTRTELNSKPLIKLILSALSIINNNWRLGDVISYVKTGLIDVSYDESDVLEMYVTTWNINGNRWTGDRIWTLNPAGYTDKMSDRDKEILNIVNDLRVRINAPLRKLTEVFTSEECNAKTISTAIYNYLIDLKIPEKLSDGRQLWNTLMKAFDELVITAGDITLTAEQYADLLMLIINETDMGKIPAAVDEVVIGNADKLRTGTVKHAYILGVNDGVFPRSQTDHSIFSDTERKILEENKINLSYGSDMKITDELLYFYDSALCAGESLTVVYSSSDLNGTHQRPSTACEQIFELFPAIKIEKYSDTKPIDLIEGYTASFDYTQIYKNTPIGQALAEIYSADENFRTRMLAMGIPLSQETYTLSEENTERIFGEEIVMTQSRIDTYVMCKFSYCCKYLLRLAEKRQAIFRSADVGNFIHRILELYLSRYYDGTEHAEIPDDFEIMTVLNEIIEEYKTAMCGNMEMMNVKLEHTIERLKKTLFLLIRNIHEEFAQSEFVPRFFEESVTINKKSGEAIAAPYKIQIDDRKSIYITGIIDRIDTYSAGNRIYLRIVDYKTGVKDFSMEDIKMGLNLQMLLYLFTLWKNPTDKLKRTIGGNEILPAGVLYFSARVPDITLKAGEDKQIVIDLANEQLKRKGVLLNEPDILQAMDKEFGGKYIPVRMTTNGISKTSEKSLLTIDEFDELMTQVNNRIADIGKELNHGDMSALPLKTSRHDACEFCANKPICRREL